MKREKKTVYYRDPVRDDFAGTHIDTNTVDATFRYEHCRLWRFGAGILYYAAALPLVWLLHRAVKGIRFVNRKNRRKVSGPCFLYGNHTMIFDAYTPSLLSFPRRASILASADTFSIRGLRNLVQMLGAVAVPNRMSGLRNFREAVGAEYDRGHDVAVFPEAHIWPYYTGIRPFSSASFSYPVRKNAPVIAFFTAYSEPKGWDRLLGRKASIRIYLSEPIYPDSSLPYKEAQLKLRNDVYRFMERTAEECSTFCVIDYVQLPPEEQEKNI